MTSLLRNSSGFQGFNGIPKIKLGNNQTNLMRENLLQLCQKQQIDNIGVLNKTGTPSSIKLQSKQNSQIYLTPKESKIKDSPLLLSQMKDSPLQTSKTFNDTKSGVFSDYYSQSRQQQNKLPQISKSNSSKFSLSSQDESANNTPGSKQNRQKTNIYSSEYSNNDQNSNVSTQENLDKIKGKSSFFRLKGQSSQTQSMTLTSIDQQTDTQTMNFNTANLGTYSNFDCEKIQQSNQSPPNSEQTAFISKQQQQMNIKTIHEEQKKQLQRVEDIISPFPANYSRKKITQRMSLNMGTASNNNAQNQLQNILQERIGGQNILNQFVWELIYAMQKNEFFEILLEEYHNCLNKVHEKISAFLMAIFSDNINGIQTSMSEFLFTFSTLNDTNIFEIKAFFYEFLTSNSSANNTFVDKQLAFKMIEVIEIFRPQLTGNEEQLNLYDISIYNLCDIIIENFVTSEFFKKYELEKINQFGKILVDFIFNKISCEYFINQFDNIFGIPLTTNHVNIVKDILKKSLQDLKEYSSVFRKNIGYQLKKVQWLISNQSSNQNYIQVIQSCSELYAIMNKVIVQVNKHYLLKHITFNNLLKIFYNQHNIFNMIDIQQIFNAKDPEQSRENIGILVSLLKQTLLNQKVSSDIAKKIETFTLSIFE